MWPILQQFGGRDDVAGRWLGFQVKKIPLGKPPSSRGKLVVESLANMVWYFALADMGAAYVKSTLLGKVLVTRTLYDEPLPRGWVTGTFTFFCQPDRPWHDRRDQKVRTRYGENAPIG